MAEYVDKVETWRIFLSPGGLRYIADSLEQQIAHKDPSARFDLYPECKEGGLSNVTLLSFLFEPSEEERLKIIESVTAQTSYKERDDVEMKSERPNDAKPDSELLGRLKRKYGPYWCLVRRPGLRTLGKLLYEIHGFADRVLHPTG